jgi:hypothetical protein
MEAARGSGGRVPALTRGIAVGGDEEESVMQAAREGPP